MVPADVLADERLSATAKLVLGVLGMEAYGSCRITISHGAIAKLCGSSRPAVLQALKQLCKVKLIEKSGVVDMQVQPYKLLHRRLAGGDKAIADQPASSVGAPNRTIPAACRKCRSICNRLPVTGICRSCKAEAKVERTARRVVREEIAGMREEVA